MDESTSKSSVELTTVEVDKADEKLAIRKKCELDIIMKYNRTKILLGRDCWYLIDTNWLSAWNAFVRGDNEPEPGPISSKDLLDDKGQPLPGLKNSIDYRGVSPLVFYIFVELHGKDTNYPDICRYTVDIYKPAVPIERIVNISLRAINKAKLKVNKIRQQWMDWELPDDEEDEHGFGTWWTCWLEKEHFEAFIYWAVNCWWCCCRTRRSSGRADIKYSAYRPLRNNNADDEDGINGNSTHSSSGGGNGDAEAPPKKISFGTRVNNALTRAYDKLVASRSKDSKAGKSGASQSSSSKTRTKRRDHKASSSNSSSAKHAQTASSSSSGNKSRSLQSMEANYSEYEESDPDEAADDHVDESDNDYEDISYGPADRSHESDQWSNQGVIQSTLQSMNR